MVDYKSVLSLIGSILVWLSVPLLLPLFIAIFSGEDIFAFVATIVLVVVTGLILERFEKEPDIGTREGFLLVMLTWLVMAIFGALPYIFAGQGSVASPINAFFESMSGFTTTGATVMEEISFARHSAAIMMWRQLSQWLGGMGIIVLAVAILPKLSIGGIQLIEAEAPGPSVERLAPRMVETARRLWLVYVGLTVLMVAILYVLHLNGQAPGMYFYNALAHAFTTLPTGGFSTEAAGVAAFSPAAQWTIIPFMFLAGTNFALLWWVFSGHFSILRENKEFLLYLAIVLLAGLMIFLGLLVTVDYDQLEAWRHSFFQTLTIITTTGYASADFAGWSGIMLTVLFLLMFVGGCAGSTGGGIKIVRWLVGIKSIVRQLFTTIHPDAVRPLRRGKKVVSEDIVQNIIIMILTYFSIFLVGTLFLQLDALRVGVEFEPLELMSASAASLGNIGPGMGAFGPMENYLVLSPVSRLICAVLMWLGRLEIFTVLIVFTPAYWKR